jgi:hypothetical protein
MRSGRCPAARAIEVWNSNETAMAATLTVILLKRVNFMLFTSYY